MYPFKWERLQKPGWRDWNRVGPNVMFLGLTSMLTDISSEMVASILPIYLLFAVGLTPLQFGFIDGISHGIGAVSRLASGLLADRWQRNREVAACGYGLSALCRLAMPIAGNAWGAISTIVVVDRIGKGIRTAPRDALISLSAAPEHLGLAFGVHRAMDTAGALLGPLVAFALLASLPHAYDVVFVTSFFFAIVGLAALLCFVKNTSARTHNIARRRLNLADTQRLLSVRPFLVLLLMGSSLALVTVADSFVFLILQRKLSMEAASFPLLYVVVAGFYLLLAIPAGWLGDRWGRSRVFLLGYALLVLSSLCVLSVGDGLGAALLSLALLGGHYACTDGILMALTSRLVPVDLRATGMAVVGTATAIARLSASILFGAVWNWQSAEWALGLFTAALAVMLVLALGIMGTLRN